MDRNEILNKLTAEERAYAEKVDALLKDEKNRARLESIRTIDEAIAFFEENGIRYTESRKDEIRKKAADLEKTAASRELTPEDLEAAAGGWSWKTAFAGGGVGAILGGVGGLLVGIATGGVGLCAIAGLAGGTLLVGGCAGASDDE